MYFSLLGRNPALSITEIESHYLTTNVVQINDRVAFFDSSEPLDAQSLGSSIRIGTVLDVPSVTADSELYEQIAAFLTEHTKQHTGKITLGLSVASSGSFSPKTRDTILTKLKSSFKKQGISLRTIPAPDPILNIATFRSNSLHRGDKKLELVVFQTPDGWKLGMSHSAPDIAGLTARDRRKPFRDSRNGMLPPQLARTLVTLATQGKSPHTLLDPFCGTGTVLLEARTRGFSVVGSDVNPTMHDGTLENLKWQDVKIGPEPAYSVSAADARDAQWPGVTTLACETYLGAPLQAHANLNEMKREIQDIDQLHRDFLTNLASQVPSGFRAALALPAWIVRGKDAPVRLSVIDSLDELGYNLLEFTHLGGHSPLFYKRDGQFVARDIIVITRK